MSSEGGIGKVIFASTCMRVIPLGEASLANLGGLVLCRISKSFATSPAEVAYTQP